ncbi:hypothetical protein WR25_19108 [Diploscapter pachys]|uniref:Glycosyl hydrolases family 38 C-terminal domain-containing protein n=1 Tax=Diploscapter pachys TaxID=2018661 RepID=A0A2A2L316_9BILA|nr:hypothetical protein WR25_19108 [Diploscapter pachys]
MLITAASLHRPLALETFYKPVIAYSTGDAIQHVKFTNLKANITVPKEVNILSIEPWDNNMVLLRLEHIYQNSELATSNKPAYIDLTNIFDAFDVRDVKETSLDGNKDPIQLSVHNQANAFDPKNVSIYPTEIRTFVMKPPEDKPSNCPKQFFSLTKRIQSLPFKYSKMFAFRLLISALLVSTVLSAILSNDWLSQYPLGKDSSYYYPNTGYVSYSTGSKPDGFYLVCGDCGIFGRK